MIDVAKAKQETLKRNSNSLKRMGKAIDDPAENTHALRIQKYRQEIPLVRATMAFNSMMVLSPYSDTTAIQTGDLVYRSFPYMESNRLAETYMLNSKSIRHKLSEIFSVNLYTSSPALVSEAKNEERIFPVDRLVELPKPAHAKTSVEKAIIERRSHRQFSNMHVPMDRIAGILFYGDGVSGTLQVSGVESEYLNPLEIKLRTAPSGGALYPVSMYLIAMNILNLPNGVYLYSPLEHIIKIYIFVKSRVKRHTID